MCVHKCISPSLLGWTRWQEAMELSNQCDLCGKCLSCVAWLNHLHSPPSCEQKQWLLTHPPSPYPEHFLGLPVHYKKWPRVVMGLLYVESAPRIVNFPVFLHITAVLPTWCGRTALPPEYRHLPTPSSRMSTLQLRDIWSGCLEAPPCSTKRGCLVHRINPQQATAILRIETPLNPTTRWQRTTNYLRNNPIPSTPSLALQRVTKHSGLYWVTPH
jgi:hypothetical protein